MKIAFHWMGRTCTVEAPEVVAGDLVKLLSGMGGAPSGSSADVTVTGGSGGFLVSHRDLVVCDTSLEAVWATELAVTRHLLSLERRHCHLHAVAALGEGGGAVVALGRSGSGKSSIAYAWYRLGRPVFGDDVVVLDDRGRVHPFPRPLKVDVARLREAGEAPEETVAWDGEAPDVWVDPEHRAGWADGGAEVAVFAEVRFVPGSPLRTIAVTGGEGLRFLLDALHPTGTTGTDALDRLVAAAVGGAFYRVEHGDAGEAALELLRLARGGRA